MFDGGNKGYITESELTEILHNAFGMETESAKKIFSQVDTNSDGRIVYGKSGSTLYVDIVAEVAQAVDSRLLGSGLKLIRSLKGFS